MHKSAIVLSAKIGTPLASMARLVAHDPGKRSENYKTHATEAADGIAHLGGQNRGGPGGGTLFFAALWVIGRINM
jgi:hypothetical protein